jgi:hypothetical protein
MKRFEIALKDFKKIIMSLVLKREDLSQIQT